MALNPCDPFSSFDISNLKWLSELYPYDFDSVERIKLEDELDLYYQNVQKDESFTNLKGITDLATVMVEKRIHKSYPLVYHLLKLPLVSPFQPQRL